jgi:HEAT repeat protein
MAENRQFQASAQIPQLIEMLASQDLDDRLAAIQDLGEIGDEQALNELLARMTPPLEEYYALSVAVGRLRKRLGTR